MNEKRILDLGMLRVGDRFILNDKKYNAGHAVSTEEAIEEFNCLKKTRNFIPRNDTLDIAIKALEKQIPMKPQVINTERIRLYNIWDWSCGNCGSFHRNPTATNYCNECGQKVDWSDVKKWDYRKMNN